MPEPWSLDQWFAAKDTIRQLYLTELGRDVLQDPEALANWLYHMREHGRDESWLRAVFRESEEWRRRHTAPFPPESGRLHVTGMGFRTQDGQPWAWRGFSWFLGYRRFLAGEDVTSDLRRLRAHGVNIVRVFGPLPWAGLEDYRHETFHIDALSTFFGLVAEHGLRIEFVPLCYAFGPQAAQRLFMRQIYRIAANHWHVLIECANEPRINGLDPVGVLEGVPRSGVLSAYGLYDADDPARPVPVLDYATIHTVRDASWARKARHAQEAQVANRVPMIADEPMGAGEPGVSYPSARSTNPHEFVWHHGIAHLYAPGSTLHTEAGKWGHVPDEGSRQAEIVRAVRDDVWRRIGPEWQLGEYAPSHLANSPVNFILNEWAYSSVLGGDSAISVRAAERPSLAVNDWRTAESWGPAGSLSRLER